MKHEDLSKLAAPCGGDWKVENAKLVNMDEPEKRFQEATDEPEKPLKAFDEFLRGEDDSSINHEDKE